ncbi:MAG: hypothetical protein M0P71_13000 [Melioribacteraceae bacterium]|jgi:hypothetical protein|nr:hypothetical protein [Melioribacteraceae bacterium]
MKTNIKLGDVFYVFTNWGICKGRISEITKSSQYRLKIDIDPENMDKDHGFYYCEDELHNSFTDAINYEVQMQMQSQMKGGVR